MFTNKRIQFKLKIVCVNIFDLLRFVFKALVKVGIKQAKQECYEHPSLHWHHLTACGSLGVFYLHSAERLPTVCSFYVCISAEPQVIGVTPSS